MAASAICRTAFLSIVEGVCKRRKCSADAGAALTVGLLIGSREPELARWLIEAEVAMNDEEMVRRGLEPSTAEANAIMLAALMSQMLLVMAADRERRGR